jgi:hypothetical protein
MYMYAPSVSLETWKFWAQKSNKGELWSSKSWKFMLHAAPYMPPARPLTRRAHPPAQYG